MLGIDVSKAHLTCCLLDPQTEKRQWVKNFHNTPAGLQQLLAATPPEAPWVMEPTGRYSTAVAQQAVAAGRQVQLAQTKRAQHFLLSINDRVKHDRVDSFGLALYGLRHRLRPYPLKSAAVERLDQLRRGRRGLAQALTRLEQQARELPHAAPTLRAAAGELRVQLQELDAQIATLLKEEEAFAAAARLQAVPGIGPVTAAAVISCLAAKAFPHPDQFVSHVGLAVHYEQSGRQAATGGQLSKRGDAEVRRLLYLAAQSNLRIAHSPFKAQYERERAKGLASTAALCAVARKLARVCWSLWKHAEEYDPTRVQRQPQEHGGKAPAPEAGEK